MKKTATNLMLMTILFVVSLVIANAVTAKLFATGVTLWGIPVVLPGAAICYSLTFLATDVIGELWGKKQANITVLYGIFAQILASALIIMTQYLPAADPNAQSAYELLLGQNWIFVTASLIAYFSSQLWYGFVFHKSRDKWIAKEGNNKKRWIWNNLSTMTSQLIDTVLFFGIALGIGFGWLGQSYMIPVLLTMMIGQYAFKFILAAIDTPIFYLLTHDFKK